MTNKSCDVKILEKATKKGKVAVVYKSKSCDVCPRFLKAARKALKDTPISLVEVEIKEDSECFNLIKTHNITGTPTLLFYEDGVLKKTLYSTGNDEDDRSNLEALGR